LLSQSTFSKCNCCAHHLITTDDENIMRDWASQKIMRTP
jgi:hypothetical protein